MKLGNVNPKFLKNNDEKVASGGKMTEINGVFAKKTKTKKTGTLITFRSFGAGGRIRTADLFITSEPLYLLSHTSKTFVIIS